MYFDFWCRSRPFFHPFPSEPHFALYQSVHRKHEACLIGCLCTSISAPLIWVDSFHLWILSLFDLCGS